MDLPTTGGRRTANKRNPIVGGNSVPLPGLARLWGEGDLVGLAWALAFTSLLHFALLSTFVWSGWIVRPWPLLAWVSLVVVWLAAWLTGWTHYADSKGKNHPSDSACDLFRRAQREYLRGNWFQAETALKHLLTRNRVDIPARLLLATLYRRIGRNGEAEKHLVDLEQLPAGRRWQLEVDRERRLLALAGTTQSATDSDVPSHPEPAHKQGLTDNEAA